LLNAPQRPSQPSQRDDLLFLFFAQDIAHVTECNAPPVQCPDSAISLAGFQVSTHGRLWVSPEEILEVNEGQKVWFTGEVSADGNSITGDASPPRSSLHL
jgi:hypothetical protein